MTRATSRLLRALCGPSNPPWVVGNARQSIYQFLGAAPENVTAFTRDFASASVFELDVNYRSAEPVVTAANQLAALLEHPDATADTLRARWTPGTTTASLGYQPATIAEAATDAAEADGVATRVRDWIACDGVSPGDIAVLWQEPESGATIAKALYRDTNITNLRERVKRRPPRFSQGRFPRLPGALRRPNGLD